MKEFFKYLFASILGFFISIIIIMFVLVISIVGIVNYSSSSSGVSVQSNTVLYLNLDQTVTERTPSNSFSKVKFMGFQGDESIGLKDLLNAIKAAKNDDNIKCIYINVTAPRAGFASMREIRNALIDFKKSKKKIIAYSEIYTQSAYYLASVADKIYLNPEGEFELKGMKSELMFFKGTLEKLGIEAQIIRVGEYKSAVEPYFMEKMSDKNRAQVTAYLNGLYETFLTDISKSRSIERDSLFNYANNYVVQTPKIALDLKLIDGLKYKDEILDGLKKLSGRGEKEAIIAVNINDYVSNASLNSNSTSVDKLAIIYANGEITGGEGDDQTIGSERISRAIRKARQDDNIKAVVLRINSPGGSALASEVMWREVELTKKIKPVIATFGDVAASGGYYIGSAADSIFVQPNTITGSIGVFGVIPNFQNLLNNKLGLTFDGVKTGEFADIMSTNRPMTAGEKTIIQKSVNRVYDTFLTRVAEGRKKDKSYIDSIGGGHVWIGTDAVQIGLADRIGSFDDAINAAAKKAKIKDYQLVEYPEVKGAFDGILSESANKVKIYFAQQELGENFYLYKQMKSVIDKSGIQARMPFNANIQ